MDDLFETEINKRGELERLSGVIEDMRQSGIRLRNELSDFISKLILE